MSTNAMTTEADPTAAQEPTDLVQSVFALLKDVAADNGQVLLEDGESEASTDTPATSTPPSREDAFRLEAFVKDFGSSGIPDEKWIFDATTYLLSGSASSIRGLGMLTNHRLLFLARIEREERDESDIIGEGFATLHLHDIKGGHERKHKGWLVLDHDIAAMHPTKDRKYETLASLRVKDIGNIELSNDVVRFQTGKREGSLKFETSEAAADWQKHLQVTSWLANHADRTIKISIPLPRLSDIGASDFHGFGSIVSLDISDSVQKVVFGFTTETGRMMVKGIRGAQAEAAALYGNAPVPSSSIDAFQSTIPESETPADTDNIAVATRKMYEFFALADDITHLQLFKVELMGKGPPMPGTLVVTPTHLCFYATSLPPRKPVRIKVPIAKLHNAHAHHVLRVHFYGFTVQVDAMRDLHFESIDKRRRDHIVELLTKAISHAAHVQSHQHHSASRREPSEAEKLAESSLPTHQVDLSHDVLTKLPRMVNPPANYFPIAASNHIVCVTIGSRGDVQPYIALCLGLMERGHRCTIVSHPEYEPWVRKYGIDYRPAGGDPGLLMKLSVEMNVFSPKYLKTALNNFRDWLDELLREIVEQCSDADLIVESPSTFGGIHAAEALGISYMRAFTMPWTKTAAYPQAFCVPKIEMGGPYNLASYGMYDQLIWGASSGQINRYRKRMLGLAPTTRNALHIERVPFMYNFSPAVVPPPAEWGNLTSVTGYWQIPSSSAAFDPPQDLLDFLAAAKKDDAKVAYIGFGSIILPSPREVMKAIYEAVDRSGIYAVVSKGWSDRATEGSESQKALPPLVPGPRVYTVDSIPHDWLLPRLDMALHHGGAGTTGASLAAGCVTLIHPFFGDQFFWANRVEKLGAGLGLSSLKADAITSALKKAATDRIMQEKAKEVQNSMKDDDGVGQACHFISRYMTRAQRTPRLLQQSQHSTFSMRSGVIKRSSSAQLDTQFSQVNLTEEPDSVEQNGTAETGSTSDSGYSSRRAGLEDDRRRAALVEKWRKEGRDALIARSSLTKGLNA